MSFAWFRWGVLLVLIALLCGGATVALHSLPGGAWQDAKPSLVAPSVTAIVASVAGLVALATQQSWQAQKMAERETELRRRRSDEYVKVITAVIGAFLPGTVEDLARDRATVGIWGSPEFVRRYRDWTTFRSDLPTSSDGSKRLTPEDTHVAHQLVADLVAVARRDLEMINEVNAADMMEMIFQDYKVSTS